MVGQKIVDLILTRALNPHQLPNKSECPLGRPEERCPFHLPLAVSCKSTFNRFNSTMDSRPYNSAHQTCLGQALSALLSQRASTMGQRTDHLR